MRTGPFSGYSGAALRRSSGIYYVFISDVTEKRQIRQDEMEEVRLEGLYQNVTELEKSLF